MAEKLLSHLIPVEMEALRVGSSAFDNRCGRHSTRFIHQMLFCRNLLRGERVPPAYFLSVRALVAPIAKLHAAILRMRLSPE